MSLLRELPMSALTERLASGGVDLLIGPYVYRIRSNVAAIGQGLARLYADFTLAPNGSFVDFDVGLRQDTIAQKLRGQAQFLFDQQSPFDTVPVQQAYAFLEWGMNWCVSLHVNEYLKLHAAVVARKGAGIIMPGIPGAGKSTLCAALGLSGWRVLSDEHALITPGTIDLTPLSRPVSLKNESIQAIQAFDSGVILGPESRNTHKGTVAHMKADMAPHSHDINTVPAALMVFPRYSRDEPQELYHRYRSASFVLAAYHSFNYSVLGEDGFDAMQHLVSQVECFDLVYHDLDWAVAKMEELVG